MSNIIKHEDLNKILSLTEQNIVAAYESPKINTLSNEDINKFIINLVNTLFASINQKVTDDDMKAICILLKNELKKYFQNATTSEIELACAKGIRKEYGDYYGISIVNIHNWINKYITSEERLISIKKYKSIKNANQENTISEEEKEKIMLNAVERNKNYAQSKEFNIENFDFGNACYDYLVSKGIISYSNEEKNEFVQIAKEHLKKDAISQKVKFEISPSGFNKIISMIEEKKSKPVIILAKKYALVKYFKSIEKQNNSNRSDDYMSPDYFNKF